MNSLIDLLRKLLESMQGPETKPVRVIVKHAFFLLVLPGLVFAGLREGEDLTFRVRWGAITGGYASLAVSNIDLKEGRPAYHFVSNARSAKWVETMYKVEDHNEAWMDTEGAYSLGYTKMIKEKHYHIEEQVAFDPVNLKYKSSSFRVDKDCHREKEGNLQGKVLDVLSSLYYVRTLPLEVGKSYVMDVHTDDKSWPLEMKVLRKESVSVKAGKFNCIVVEPVLREPGIFISKGKSLEVWLTDDDQKMPVMMRAEIFVGHVTAELVKYSEPAADTIHVAHKGSGAQSKTYFDPTKELADDSTVASLQ